MTSVEPSDVSSSSASTHHGTPRQAARSIAPSAGVLPGLRLTFNPARRFSCPGGYGRATTNGAWGVHEYAGEWKPPDPYRDSLEAIQAKFEALNSRNFALNQDYAAVLRERAADAVTPVPAG